MTEGLNVPPPTYGTDRLAAELRRRRADSGPQYRAEVLRVAGNRVEVLVDNNTTPATLRTTARNLRPGDVALVQKIGGRWEVVANESWHEPPNVGSTPSGNPPAVSGSTSTGIPSPDRVPAPYFNVRGAAGPNADPITSINENRDSLARIESWAVSLHLDLIQWRGVLQDLTDAVKSLDSRLDSLQSQGNSNRELVRGVRDRLGDVMDALRDEKIIR